MLAHPNHYQAGGANSYPAVDAGGDAGYPTTIIGSAVTFGTIVTAAFSSDPLLDLTDVDGPQSPLMVCQLPAAAVPHSSLAGPRSLQTALYGVVQEEDGIAEDQKGRVASGFVTIKARVLVGATNGFKAHTPLMADVAGTPGRLIEWDGSGKCIALLARAVANTGSAAESLQWVHFNGVYGFAAGGDALT